MSLAAALEDRLGKPVRLLNDAEVQGFGIVTGHGLEMVLTLGPGAGTAVFRDGELMPYHELSQHPIHNGKTYDDYIGDHARRRHGKKKWRRHARRTIDVLASLLNYDTRYLGGGNATKATRLPASVVIASNDAGITGRIRLWDAGAERFFRPVAGAGR